MQEEQQTKKCPFCAEEIIDEAIKCKHCKSDLTIDSDKKKKLSASKHENYNLFTIISFMFPFIGIVLGVIYLAKNDSLDKKLGEHSLAMSTFFGIFWLCILSCF